MTLILTALCKNGVCVCADKRNTKPHREPEDNQYKIFSFENTPIIIFNHGVNKFNNKRWDKYCAEYEISKRWDGRSLFEISEDFKEFIEEDVRKELEKNYHKGLVKYTTSAFDFCGITTRSVNFKIYELFWSYKSGGLQLEKPPLGRLVLSGEGKDCLKGYLEKNKKLNKDRYWKNLDTTEARNELERLFKVAVIEQKKCGGVEFSDTFDTECITGKFST